jgi:hypothetical protein
MRRRSKQKYFGPQSEYTPSEIAAVVEAFLTETAATREEAVVATKTEAFPSKYLKASDLKGPVVLTISDAPRETLEYQGKKESKHVLYFERTQKRLPLNITNWDGVVNATGVSDSDQWPGRAIEVYPTQCEVKGKTVDCVRIRRPSARA